MRRLISAVAAVSLVALVPITGAQAEDVVDAPREIIDEVGQSEPTLDCTITGTDEADVLRGTRGADVICGGDGDDTISGLGGNDTIYGGEGDDKLIGGAGADNLDGESGNDRLEGGSGGDDLDGGEGNDSAAGGSGADEIELGAGDDRAVGGGGSDAINGGEGTDALNGGRGVDYCAPSSEDTSISCFYDSSLPEVTSVSIQSNTVDTGASDQYVSVDVGVKDTGSGVSWLQLFFSDRDFQVYLYGWAGWGRTCDSTSVPESDKGARQFVESCVVSGDANEGVLRLFVQVPRYTRAGTFELEFAGIYDAASNYTWMDRSQLNSNGLAASIVQIDEGDASRPIVTSLKMLNTSINTSEASQTVELEIGVSDVGSGVSWISVNFADETYSVNLSGWASAWAACDDHFGYTYGCLSSGTTNDGTYKLAITVPRQTRAGTYTLQSLYMTDLAGNYTILGTTELADAGFSASFVQEDTGDAFAPELISVAVDPSAIDTGLAEQQVTARVTARDQGTGISWMSLYFVNAETGTWAYGWASGGEACTEENRTWPYFGCLESGTVWDGTYAMNISVPAHAPRGTYQLQGVWVSDAAGNYTWLWSDQLAEIGIEASFVNG